MKQRLELVDFLKGFSIFTIVVMHLLQDQTDNALLGNALAFGGAGVHVFILCSGFGLYLSHLRKPMGYFSFLRRRFTKIYLPYIIVILLSVAIPFYWAHVDKLACLLSHIFLYKMFVPEYEQSFGGQMWFFSTIVQFYLVWPLIVYIFEKLSVKRPFVPLAIGLAISLGWASVVAWIGKGDVRVWNSFFLQYIWEFVLGMYLAKKYYDDASYIRVPDIKWLAMAAVVCLALTGFAGIKGGILKLYNDVPSMIAYLSLALILYRLAFTNKLFVFTNKFSFEWYLTHILVFVCIDYIVEYQCNCPPPYMDDLLGLLLLLFKFLVSYVVAWGYGRILSRLKMR